jgi:hypothetical protein
LHATSRAPLNKALDNMPDKVALRGQLQTIKNNYALAQFGIALMAEEGAVNRFKAALEMLSGNPELATFSYITYVFENDQLLRHATQQFRGSVMRNCLKETFELVKLYGEETNQSTVVAQADWYQFLRIVRNCLSHDMRLQFRKNDLKRLPVMWSDITIDSSMQGEPLPDALTRSRTTELMDSVIHHMEKHVV